MAMKKTIQMNSETTDILLKDAFEEYILEKTARNLAQPTLTSYRESFQRFTKFAGNEITGDMINAKFIYRWIATMKSENIKDISINHYLRETRTFLNWCMTDGREYVKPKFKIDLLIEQESPLKMFSLEEQRKLTKKPSNKNDFVEWRTFAIVNWVLATGNRISTIINVKMNDIDFNNREITLTHTKNMTGPY